MERFTGEVGCQRPYRGSVKIRAKGIIMINADPRGVEPEDRTLVVSESPGSGNTRVIVAVIPAHNEERFIASVVLTTLLYADRVVVVDDGSTDRTAALAASVGAHVVSMGVNAGKGAALNAGFRVARQYFPTVIVCLDGDAQHDPAEIPTLIGPILERQADIVIGSRFLTVRSRIPGWRQLGQHALTTVTNTLSGMHVTDSQSGFRAFSPDAVEVLRFKSNGLSLESEMQFLIQTFHLRVSEVPISVKYLDGNKRNPVVHGLQVLDSVVTLVARRRPLLFFSVPGIVLAVIGVLLGIMVSLTMQRTGTLMTGTAMVTVLLVIVGLVLAMTGVMLHSVGHFVGRIREEIKELADTFLLSR